MKIKIAKTFFFCFLSITAIIHFQSCYTTVKQNETGKTEESKVSTDSLPPGSCVIEGVVHDYTRKVPPRELDLESPKIYYLDNYFWVSNAPSYSINYIFLEGVDISYENKYVRIVGIIQNAPSSYYVNVQTPLNIRVYVSKIEIIQ